MYLHGKVCISTYLPTDRYYITSAISSSINQSKALLTPVINTLTVFNKKKTIPQLKIYIYLHVISKDGAIHLHFILYAQRCKKESPRIARVRLPRKTPYISSKSMYVQHSW